MGQETQSPMPRIRQETNIMRRHGFILLEKIQQDLKLKSLGNISSLNYISLLGGVRTEVETIRKKIGLVDSTDSFTFLPFLFILFHFLFHIPPSLLSYFPPSLLPLLLSFILFFPFVDFLSPFDFFRRYGMKKQKDNTLIKGGDWKVNRKEDKSRV